MMILFYSSKFLSKARLCTDSSLDRLAEVAPPHGGALVPMPMWGSSRSTDATTAWRFDPVEGIEGIEGIACVKFRRR